MAIFRGVGGSGSSSDNSFLQEVTAQATSAEASATSAANSLATIQNTEVTSASFNTGDGVLTLTKLGGATVTADLDGRFLTSYTETNDLSSAVTWVNVPNAYITAGSVTQHQAALTITESQISDLQSYLTSYTETNNLTTAVTWANVPDANITQSSVTQHQGALSITESQISDLQTYLTAETNDLSTTVTWANVPDANITESSVTQHLTASNVANAGALMDSEVTNLAQVKAFDSSDYLTAHQDISGKANLSGATFTGNVTTTGTITADGGYSTSTGNFVTLSGSITTNSGNISANSGNISTSGNIIVGGTVDGRDVAADGTKLDSLKGTLTSNYWDSMQWQQGANRQLTTALTQYGDTQYVKHINTTYKTYVDLSLDLVYNSASGTNDAFGYLSVIAPSPTGETTVNMGTCTTFSSGVSYITAFSVSGDWTEYLSRYAGLSKNSDGSNAMGVPYKWVYNSYANSTTMWVSAYGNPPSNGDTIYSHPFDWETSGTEINGETLSIDNSSGSGVSFRRDYKIYLGRFQQRAGYKFQAKENLSSDVVALDTLRMTTTEYEA